MMNDKELNEFTKSVIKEADLETPSANFLQNVMSQIKAESVQNVEVVYKPLISKIGWVFIALIIVLGFFAALYSGSSTSIFSSLDLSYFENFKFTLDFPDFKFSKIFTFSVMVLAAMVLVQVYGIRHFYSKE